MQNKPYARHWKIFSWVEFIEECLVASGIAGTILLVNYQTSAGRAWMCFIFGTVALFSMRVLIRFAVSCPRCHRRFFNALYFFEVQHKCQSCGLIFKAESDENATEASWTIGPTGV